MPEFLSPRYVPFLNFTFGFVHHNAGNSFVTVSSTEGGCEDVIKTLFFLSRHLKADCEGNLFSRGLLQDPNATLLHSTSHRNKFRFSSCSHLNKTSDVRPAKPTKSASPVKYECSAFGHSLARCALIYHSNRIGLCDIEN